MTSPARRHWQRMTAATAGDNPAAARAAGNLHELMQATLWEATRRLKDIRSVENKIKAKAEILPQFDDYVAGVLQADAGEQDDVLMTVMVWRLDIGDLAGGLEIADYALRHGLQTPDKYKRDTATIVAEQVAEESLAVVQSLDQSAESVSVAVDHLGHLAHARDLVAEADLHDQVRAKLHKALGYAYRAKGGHAQDALDELRRAVELNDKIGVKKDIEKLEREIKNAGGQG